jgi:hypothetical protein
MALTHSAAVDTPTRDPIDATVRGPCDAGQGQGGNGLGDLAGPREAAGANREAQKWRTL